MAYNPEPMPEENRQPRVMYLQLARNVWTWPVICALLAAGAALWVAAHALEVARGRRPDAY